MAVNMGTAVAYLDLDTSKFTKGFVSAYNDLKVFGDRTATAGQMVNGLMSAMSTVGGTLTRSVTVPLLGIGAASVKTAADFEQGMAEVQAISGATGKEFDALNEKAIEMGAKTKFSATEAASAFKYMAMAGWDTADMLDGIEGIMNLAAASGEDLALTSDIVTDALTAFGLSAKDSAHFADVLAKASSSSNTNVALMGETFQYVAPVAGALGYSIEDTAVAIGLMANAGIKGSQSGTALRAMLTRLAKPTRLVKKALEEYNIALTNTDGTIKPFNQLLLELREKFSGLTEAEKANLAATLAGQEGMSGLLAIVNASDEDFNNLVSSINNAEGATKEMSDVMLNTTKGALTLLKSNLESAGIAIGKRMTPYIVKLAEGISKLVTRFNNLSDAQVDNIVKWAGIVAVAGPVLKLVSGILPKLVMLGKGFTTVAGGASLFIQALSLSRRGMSDAAMQVSGLYRGLSTLGSGLLSLANPVTITIALLGALAAAVYVNVKANQKQIEEYSKLSEENQKLIDGIDEQKEAYDGMMKNRKDTINSLNTEATRINNLYSELTTLVDANGRVQAGNEERVSYILGELSNALGQEITMTDGVIDSYGRLGESIEETMRIKKANALLSAMEEDYAEAVRKQVEAQNNYNDALQAKMDKQREVTQIESDLAKMESDYSNTLIKDSSVVKRYAEEHKNMENKLKGANNQLEDLDDALGDAEQALVGYNETVQNYEGLSASIMSGNAEEISLALLKIEQGFVTAETATRESLEQQKADIEEKYEEMVQALEAGAPGVTQAMVDQMKNLSDQATAELDLYMTNQKEMFASKFRMLGIEAPQALIDSIMSMTPEMQNEVNTLMDLLINGTGLKGEELKALFSNLGIQAPTELYTQLEAMQPSVQASALDLLTQLQTAEASKRPEIIQQLKDLGIKMDDNLAQGIKSNTPVVKTESGAIATSARDTMQTKLLEQGDLDAPRVGSIKNAADVARGAFSTMQSVFNSGVLAVRAVVNGSHATGLSYVPFNGYIAELHEGERVLTKQENEDYNRGGRGSKSGDTFVFYNTQPNPYEYSRQMKRAKQELLYGI